MKIMISFKDPDAVSEAYSDHKSELVKTLMADLKLSKAGAEAEADDRMEKAREISSKYFEWGEYVLIEIDTDTGTATVVPCE